MLRRKEGADKAFGGLRQWPCATGDSLQEEVGVNGSPFYIDTPWLGIPSKGPLASLQ